MVAKPRARNSAADYALVGLILFLLNGALIVYSPMWSLCMPLAFIGPLFALIAVGKLVIGRRAARAALNSASAAPAAPPATRHKRRHVVFVTFVAVITLLHLAAGGNRLWFRLGVEWRLRQVGGLARVEQWTQQHVDKLRRRFDEIGGLRGMERLEHDDRLEFLFVRPPARPDWLAPLTSYLPARVSNDIEGRPDGIDFSLGGWDHAWGMSVQADSSSPPPPPATSSPTSQTSSSSSPSSQPSSSATRVTENRWPSRLSDRSHLWGRPW